MHAFAASHPRGAPVLVTGVLALAVAGCGTMPLDPEQWPGPQVPERRSPSAAPAAALEDVAAGERAFSDATLRSAVNQQLRLDRVLDPAAVDVDVEGAIVTLRGTAPNLLARDRAVELVSGIRGVRGVVDQLEVRPVARSDNQIERDVRAALEDASSLGDVEVAVTVEGGVVTLAGEVGRRAEATRALQLARGIVGVRNVVDALTLEPTSVRSDEDIRGTLERALALDARFGDEVVETGVNDGVVTLTGTVGSVLHRDLAAEYAREAGARAVDVTGLDVEGFDDDVTRPVAFIADPLVEDAVRSALSRDPRLDDGAVRVGVSDGVATLRGSVRTVAARDAATRLARQARGVAEVDNRLRVRSSTDVSDDEITARVEGALARDPWLMDAELTVLVDDGEVTLAGELPNRYSRARATQLVSAVEGVDGVLDRLTVRPWTHMTDEELRASVLEELFWNPYVDPANLEVEVEGGVVWIGGEARDLQAAASARESAFLAGARSVVNEIEVPTAPPDVRTTIDQQARPDYLRREPFVPDTPFRGG